MADVAFPELISRRRGHLSRWLPVAAWMAGIFVLSSIERLPGGSVVPDWLSHGLAYGLGAVLIARALAADPSRVEPKAALLAVALATLYGVSDEYHQSFVPGRTAEVSDVGKDFAGAALFVLLYRWWRSGPAVPAAEGGR